MMAQLNGRYNGDYLITSYILRHRYYADIKYLKYPLEQPDT